jgi:hypothetical protein
MPAGGRGRFMPEPRPALFPFRSPRVQQLIRHPSDARHKTPGANSLQRERVDGRRADESLRPVFLFRCYRWLRLALGIGARGRQPACGVSAGLLNPRRDKMQ